MHFSKIFKTIRNDNIIIRVFNLADVEKIIEFVNSNDFIKSGMMDLSPFIASKNGVGLAIDFDYSYHDILSNTIYKYFTKIVKENKNNDIDIDDYKKYMKSIVKNENNQKIKFIYNEIINNIDNYSTIDMILKYYNSNKLNIIKYLVYEIYNIYDYDKALDIISDYDKLIDLDIDNKYLILVKKFISNNEYKKLTENKFKELLDDTIKLNTGYDTNELNDLLINKKNKLYNIINMTFKKNNCYQELLYYLNKYLNDINFDYKKTWLVNLDTFITKDDIKIIIRKVIKANEINKIVIERFINIVLLSNNTKIENSIKEIFREAIINTYNNRSKNKDKFVRDAIKQYILINKINGFTNDNKHRDSVVKNISPYKSFYIISEYRNKDDDTLDNMIDKYVNNIISDIKK